MNHFLTEAASAPTAVGGMTSTIVMLVMMLAVFYFMLIRPENKRKKEAEDFMKDKVLTPVADALGHKSMKGGTVTPLWKTSITSYVMPNIVREWFEKQQLDVPKWVPEKVSA